MRLIHAITFMGLLTTAACGAGPDADSSLELSNSDVRSEAKAFFVKYPHANPKLERVRVALSGIDQEGNWVRNFATQHSISWTQKTNAALSSEKTEAIIQAAYAFATKSRKKALFKLALVDKTSAKKAADQALSQIGLEPSLDGDNRTNSALQRLSSKAETALLDPSIDVYVAVLHSPDADWEQGAVFVDHKNHELLFATGAFGN